MIYITGSTNFKDSDIIADRLDGLLAERDINKVITTNSKGTDAFIISWCVKRGIPYKRHESKSRVGYANRRINKTILEIMKKSTSVIILDDLSGCKNVAITLGVSQAQNKQFERLKVKQNEYIHTIRAN